jgi:hypothetical protein
LTEKEQEYVRIVRSFAVFSVPDRICEEILEALHSPKWDWYKDSDGCTCATEIFWPTKCFPPCVRHDFDCRMGTPGTESSARFYRLQRAYGVGAARSGLRTAGVFVAWYSWFKWRKGYRRYERND